MVKCEDDTPIILGLDDIQKLKLVKRIDSLIIDKPEVIRNNTNLFEGLGDLK